MFINTGSVRLTNILGVWLKDSLLSKEKLHIYQKQLYLATKQALALAH